MHLYITDFVNIHPGGREMIRLAENRDSTYLFWSYHIDRNKANKYLSHLHCLGSVNSCEEENYLSPSLLFTLQVYVKYDSFYENLSSCLSYFYNINKIKN